MKEYRIGEGAMDTYFGKKDFYTAKMPINAVITALSKEAWCLVGV